MYLCKKYISDFSELSNIDIGRYQSVSFSISNSIPVIIIIIMCFCQEWYKCKIGNKEEYINIYKITYFELYCIICICSVLRFKVNLS